MAEYHHRGNHPSFNDTFGETEPPSVELIQKYLTKGYADTCKSSEDASAHHGWVHLALLGNVRKLKKGGKG